MQLSSSSAPPPSSLPPAAAPGYDLRDSGGGGGGGGGGDVVLLDGLPARFTVGCDHLAFSTSARPFPGFREIPPGAHLVWVAPTDSTSSRTGFWFVGGAPPRPKSGKTAGRDGDGDGPAPAPAPGRVVHVKRWDAFNEVLADPPPPVAAAAAPEEEQRRRLERVFPSLAPYQFAAAAAASEDPPGNPPLPPPPPPRLPGVIRHRQGRAEPGPESDDPLLGTLDKAAVWSRLTSAITPRLLDSIVVAAPLPPPRDDDDDDNHHHHHHHHRAAAGATTWPVTSSDRVLGESRSAEEARLYGDDGGGGDAGETPSTSTSNNHQLQFTFRMDAPLFDRSAEGGERTRQALDPTDWILGVLEGARTRPALPTATTDDDDDDDDDDEGGRRRLVGELQFAFLTGAHLGNLPCLEQWFFTASRLVFRAHGLAAARPRLARELVRTFHAQLAYAERFLDLEDGTGGDVLAAVMPGDMAAHALQRVLVTYRARLFDRDRSRDRERISPGGDGDGDGDGDAGASTRKVGEDGDGGGGGEKAAVRRAFAALEAWLRRRRGWDLRADSYARSGGVMLEDGEVVQAERADFEDEDERGEFAPVVMELDAEGRPADLVSWDD